MSRRPVLIIAAVLGAMSLLACGGGDSKETSAGGPTSIDAPAPTDPAPASTTTTEPGNGPAVASPGCAAPGSATEVEQKFTMDVAGVERWYLLTALEPTTEEPRPLVIDFHGLAEGAKVHATMSQFSALAAEEDFIVAFPHGSGSSIVGWNAGPGDQEGDRAFVDALLERLSEERCFDQSRVYATGLSNGAFMTSTVGCEMSDRFAAIAPVSGVLFTEPCEADRPVPIVTFHGTSDPILQFNGGVDGDYLGGALEGRGADPTATTVPRPFDLDGEGYPANVRDWADHNGCDPTPTDTEISAEVLKRVYDCPAGGDVEFYVIVGGGHSWPGSEFSDSIGSIVGHTTFDISATEVMWEFFGRFQVPTG